MNNDEHNVEEFLKDLSCLSRKYGLILRGTVYGDLYTTPMGEFDRLPNKGYGDFENYGAYCWGVK